MLDKATKGRTRVHDGCYKQEGLSSRYKEEGPSSKGLRLSNWIHEKRSTFFSKSAV